MWSDSIVTSGQNVALIGQYNDPFVGKIMASNYLELSLPASKEVDKYAIFDSVYIQLSPNGSYFGDTTLTQNIQVYRTTQVLLFNDGKMYNSSSTEVEDTPLATASFIVQPSNAHRTFDIRLPNYVGQELLDVFIENSTKIENNESFASFFKGLAFFPKDNDQTAVIGYNLADSAFKMIVYYHVTNDRKEDRQLIFTASQIKQYNKISTDRSQTLLKDLNNRNIEIPASLTENQAYAATGAPLHIKLEFPYLNNLQELGQYGRIEKGILYIKPIRASYIEGIPLPPELNMYIINESEVALSWITDPSNQNSLQTGNLTIDYLYHENTSYQFDITNYLNSQLGLSNARKLNLQLIIPTNDAAKTIKRLVIGDTNNDNEINRMQLIIYYSSYHGNN
jgi:hypothetical protein